MLSLFPEKCVVVYKWRHVYLRLDLQDHGFVRRWKTVLAHVGRGVAEVRDIFEEACLLTDSH